ncbi:MAG: flavodoxin reductase [Bacteroidota bacterium]
MKHIVKIKAIEHITPDVLRIITEKPNQYEFEPGQATDIAINMVGWEDELRAFTFTSLPTDNDLEFTIKTYPSHNGVTNRLLYLKKDDELILHDVFGDISYKGEGLFIAGGAGITPFLSILKQLHTDNRLGKNKLIFANKTKSDIIHEQEFNKLLGENFINVLSAEELTGYETGYITEEMINANMPASKNIYLCGPPQMMEAVEKHLASLNIDESYIIKEGF